MARPDNPQWHIDPQEVAELLGSQPESIRNGAFGAGQRFAVGEGTLELFSRAGVAKFRNKDGSLTGQVRSAEEPTVDLENARLIFFQPEPRAALVFRQDGSFESVSSPEALRAVENSGTAARKESLPPSPHDAGSGHPVPSGEVSEDEGDTVVDASDRFRQQTGERQKDPVVQFFGNLVYTPVVRETPDRTVMHFKVGEHPNEEETVYHFVIPHKDVAAGLKARNLTKGQDVQINGYLKTGTRVNEKTGEEEAYPYVFATRVSGRDTDSKPWTVWHGKRQTTASKQARSR